MLSFETLEIASRIAKQLSERKISIETKPGSLASFVSTEHVANNVARTATQGEYIEILNRESRGITLEGQGTQSINDEKMEWASAALTKGISATLDISKNIIVPMIEGALSDLETKMEKTFSRGVHDYLIVEDEAPAFFLDSRIENLFERYKDIPVRDFETTVLFPELEINELKSRIKTGDEDINDMLTTLLDGNWEEIGNQYEYFFVRNGTMYLETRYQKRPQILVALYFLTLGLEANLPDGVNGSLNVVNNALRNLRGSLGAVIWRAIKRINDSSNSKNLIIDVDFSLDAKKIIVNKAVYNRFLDEGGSPESIMVSVAKNLSLVYDVILSGKEKLNKLWESHVDTLTSRAEANRLTNVIDILNSYFLGQINDLDTLPKGAGSKLDMVKRLEKEIRNVYLSDLTNMPLKVKCIVFNVFFPEHNDCRFVIDEIDKTEADEQSIGDLTIRVTIALVANWLVSNLEVNKSHD